MKINETSLKVVECLVAITQLIFKCWHPVYLNGMCHGSHAGLNVLQMSFFLPVPLGLVLYSDGDTSLHSGGSVQEPFERCSPLMSSVISILKAEIDLFSSALNDVTGSHHEGRAVFDDRRQRFLVEFAALQRKHVEMVDAALTSQQALQKVSNFNVMRY